MSRRFAMSADPCRFLGGTRTVLENCGSVLRELRVMRQPGGIGTVPQERLQNAIVQRAGGLR